VNEEEVKENIETLLQLFECELRWTLW
jgi:hypothetical protein